MSAAELRTRAVRACYAHAALARDPGAAGYSEGMAQRLAVTREPVTAAYVEGVEAAVAAQLAEVQAVEVSGARVRVKRADRWGCAIGLPTEADARSLAAELAGATSG